MHAQAAEHLRMSLYRVVADSELGLLLVRDFVMRLGDDAFMPDHLLIMPARLQCLHPSYLDGPADLVVEITWPGRERDDTVLRRQAYAAGGVPEYWIVDPAAQTMTFLHLVDGTYQEQPLAADGEYQTPQLPGLVCVPRRLWEALCHSDQRQSWHACAVFARAALTQAWNAAITDELATLPFAPAIGRQPTLITFEQYMGWCPEGWFELIDNQIGIRSWQGTRNLLGLLLLTFGLDAALTILHPRDWVAALLTEEERRQDNASRRDR